MVLVATASPVHLTEPTGRNDGGNAKPEATNQSSPQPTPMLSVEEDLRQISFRKVSKACLSSSTIPSSMMDMSKNYEMSAKENNGRESPLSLRVRFIDGNNAHLHQSRTSLENNLYTVRGRHEQASISKLSSSEQEEPPEATSPQVTSILSSKTKHPTRSNGNISPGHNKATITTLAHPTVSVFERLSKTETIAFMNQKFLNSNPIIERKMKRSTSAPPSLRSKHVDFVKQNSYRSTVTSPTKSQTKFSPMNKLKKPLLADEVDPLVTTSSPDLFDRLAKKDTELSKSRRRQRTTTKDSKLANNTVMGDSRRTRRRSLGRTHSFDRWKTTQYVDFNKKKTATTKTKVGTKRAKQILDDTFDLESTGPPMEIEFSKNTSILCSNKFEPEAGFEELDLFELGLNSPLAEYEAGVMSAKALASEIMNALMWRDLPSNIKWDVKRPLERELAMPIGEIGYSFMIEAVGHSILSEYDLSEDEELHTASATGNISFLPDQEVQVENYSCIHS